MAVLTTAALTPPSPPTPTPTINQGEAATKFYVVTEGGFDLTVATEADPAVLVAQVRTPTPSPNPNPSPSPNPNPSPDLNPNPGPSPSPSLSPGPNPGRWGRQAPSTRKP